MLEGGDGDDELNGSGTLDGGSGDDDLNGAGAGDTLFGGEGRDTMSGNGGDDVIEGAAGDDTLVGGDGNDVLRGGLGNDIYIVKSLDDTIIENDGEGIDTIRTTLASYVLTEANVERLLGAVETGQALTGNAFDNTITGRTGNDTLQGEGGDDTLDGFHGNDTLLGGDGRDTLIGGVGDDTLDGGAGFDVASYAGASGAVQVTLAQPGVAQAVGSVLGNDTLISIEGLLGSAFDDALTGGTGNDTLDGGAGSDTLAGGAGDDTYVVDSAGDTVSEAGGAGTDTVRTALAAVMLTANVENLVGLSIAGQALTGNALDNAITGLGGDDFLEGLGGNDTLDGGFGADMANYENAAGAVEISLSHQGVAQAVGGGQGFDTLISIEGVIGSGYDDSLVGDGGANRLVGRAGNDTLVGRDANDRLLGQDGNDRLNGGAGQDLMAGGTGDDTFYVDDVGDGVNETASAGWDVVRAAIDYALTDNVEELFIGGAGHDGTGNALDNVLHGSGSSNLLSGLAGNDIIRGGGGRDAIDGGDGADLLDGGVGKDTLTGGAGRDVFQFRDGDFGANRSLADVIVDFSHADAEKINLQLVDANSGAAGNQAFAFIGSGAFTGTAGQLHYAQAGGNTYVEGDTDGDGTADFVIALTGLHTLVASDFVL